MKTTDNKITDKVYTLEINRYKYEEWELVGVFSTREKAEVYLVTHYKEEEVNDHYIGEWTLC